MGSGRACSRLDGAGGMTTTSRVGRGMRRWENKDDEWIKGVEYDDGIT